MVEAHDRAKSLTSWLGSGEIKEGAEVSLFPSRAHPQWLADLLLGSTSGRFHHLSVAPHWRPDTRAFGSNSRPTPLHNISEKRDFVEIKRGHLVEKFSTPVLDQDPQREGYKMKSRGQLADSQLRNKFVSDNGLKSKPGLSHEERWIVPMAERNCRPSYSAA